eukprot:Nk52_evm10s377 gene=Nk52_evmTU10s377
MPMQTKDVAGVMTIGQAAFMTLSVVIEVVGALMVIYWVHKETSYSFYPFVTGVFAQATDYNAWYYYYVSASAVVLAVATIVQIILSFMKKASTFNYLIPALHATVFGPSIIFAFVANIEYESKDTTEGLVGFVGAIFLIVGSFGAILSSAYAFNKKATLKHLRLHQEKSNMVMGLHFLTFAITIAGFACTYAFAGKLYSELNKEDRLFASDNTWYYWVYPALILLADGYHTFHFFAKRQFRPYFSVLHASLYAIALLQTYIMFQHESSCSESLCSYTKAGKAGATLLVVSQFINAVLSAQFVMTIFNGEQLMNPKKSEECHHKNNNTKSNTSGIKALSATSFVLLVFGAIFGFIWLAKYTDYLNGKVLQWSVSTTDMVWVYFFICAFFFVAGGYGLAFHFLRRKHSPMVLLMLTCLPYLAYFMCMVAVAQKATYCDGTSADINPSHVIPDFASDSFDSACSYTSLGVIGMYFFLVVSCTAPAALAVLE